MSWHPILGLVLLIALLPGCIDSPDTSQGKTEAERFVLLPTLTVGSTAKYVVNGAPTGLLSGMPLSHIPDGSGKAVASVRNETIDVSLSKVRIIDSGGRSTDAIGIEYSLHRGSEGIPLQNQYASSKGGLLAQDMFTGVNNADGSRDLVRGADWPGGTPDTLNALLFSGRNVTSGPLETPLFMHHDSPYAQITVNVRWQADVADTGHVGLRLDDESILALRRWDGYTISFDAECPFPQTIAVKRGEIDLFSAIRTECTIGEGGPAAMTAFDSRVIEPNPGLVHVVPGRPVVGDIAFREAWSLHAAYDELKNDSRYQEHCQSPCTVIGLAWGEGPRSYSNLLGLEEGEEQVLQWVFDLWNGDAISSMASELGESGEPMIRVLERDIEWDTSGGSTAIDLEVMESLSRLMDYEQPLWMEWRARALDFSGASTPADDWYVQIGKGERLIGESGSTAGIPLRIPTTNGGRLYHYFAAEALVIE